MMGSLRTVAAALIVFVVAAGTASAAKDPGFKTSQAAMITPVAPGVTVEPIITVGETLASGYKFESIPDGISFQRHGRNIDVYVNHETSLVPFPLFPPTTFFDYTNAMVSKLVLNSQTAGVLEGSYVIPSSANYQRFCSNFLATRRHGFGDRPLLLTNEEATDFVNRTGTAWPAGPGAEQAGLVVAYDVKTGAYRSIYGMGRHNHENSVAVPDYGYPVVLSGDDTFSAPASQLYMYTARNGNAVWNDEGALWAFRSSDPATNDYGDLTGSESVAGEFIPVPREIAVGDQTPLETWSNANNVFQFIRVEDVAYDRKQTNVVYFADTGEPRALPDPATGRLRRGPSGTMGPYPNGRIFKLVLDRKDPTKVDSLSILIDGDDGGAKNPLEIHQPDNVETTNGSLFIQEDPGSHNQYAATEPGATTARIWHYDLATGTLTVVAKVDQSADPAARLGAWESSGIVDASKAFGPGAFLVDVQAGTISLDRVEGPDGNGDGRPDTVLEREGGQLLLLRIAGETDVAEPDDD
ncbi:MAG: hypothetical protein ACRDNX_09610 [Gaiellaceae bacterium]